VRTLIVAVNGGGALAVSEGEIGAEVEEIFESVAAAACVDETLGDYFNLQVAFVASKEDASTVLRNAASSSTLISTDQTFSTLFSSVYNDIINSQTSDPTPVAEAILACNDAYSRASRMSRAKLAMWKHRVSRGLLVDKFGSSADSLLKRTLDLFDRDTMAAAGLPGAGEKRLEIRALLQD
jgi:hypothetical protein